MYNLKEVISLQKAESLSKVLWNARDSIGMPMLDQGKVFSNLTTATMFTYKKTYKLYFDKQWEDLVRHLKNSGII